MAELAAGMALSVRVEMNGKLLRRQLAPVCCPQPDREILAQDHAAPTAAFESRRWERGLDVGAA